MAGSTAPVRAPTSVCTVANYARKHNPWMDFSNVPTTTAHAMTAFPTDYTTLPTVSYVVPNPKRLHRR